MGRCAARGADGGVLMDGMDWMDGMDGMDGMDKRAIAVWLSPV